MKIDLKVLHSRHPAEYEAVFNAGVAHERDRVAALVHAGTVAGAMDLALAAIKSGSDLDAKLSAQFLERGMCRRMQEDRLADDFEVSLASDGAKGSQTGAEAGKSPADYVADLVVDGIKSGSVDRDARSARVTGVRQ